MNKTPPELGRAFVFAGLTVALALGIIGSCYYHRHPGAVTTTNPRQISRVAMLDAQAKPHFDEARRNIPSVVDQMTGTGALCKLCWLMSRDKITGSHKLRREFRHRHGFSMWGELRRVEVSSFRLSPAGHGYQQSSVAN